VSEPLPMPSYDDLTYYQRSAWKRWSRKVQESFLRGLRAKKAVRELTRAKKALKEAEVEYEAAFAALREARNEEHRD
jgi:hypothetical protein